MRGNDVPPPPGDVDINLPEEAVELRAAAHDHAHGVAAGMGVDAGEGEFGHGRDLTGSEAVTCPNRGKYAIGSNAWQLTLA